jgi:hypothetical protein
MVIRNPAACAYPEERSRGGRHRPAPAFGVKIQVPYRGLRAPSSIVGRQRDRSCAEESFRYRLRHDGRQLRRTFLPATLMQFMFATTDAPRPVAIVIMLL